MFKEVWEPTTKETYGHYTLTTATGKLKSIDTTSHKGQLIDPVAFAYDFGARMYDARIGHFVSVDPLQAKYPSLTPYGYAGNSPIVFIDVDGKYFDLNKLSKAEKREFLAHVQIQSAKDPYFKLMYQQFAASKNPYTVIINPKQQSPGAFLASNNGKGGTFTFSSLGGMKNSETINEEFFHAYQLNLYGKKKMDKIGGSNIEFEPKFLDAYKKVESGGLLTEQGGEEAAYKVVYSMDPEQKVLNSEQKTNYQSGVEDFRKHWAIKNKESKANNRYDDPTTSDGPDAVMDLINKVHTAGEKMPDSSVKIKAKK